MFLAFDLPDGSMRNNLRTRCWDAGLATLTCGSRSLRFRPALVFSEDDVDRSLVILRAALREVSKTGG